MNTFDILKESIKKVPILKYALGVAGIMAAVAIIKTMGVDNYQIPVVTILVMIGFMILLFIFASVSKSKDQKIKFAGYMMIYSTIIAFSLSSFLLITSVFFNYPKPLSEILNLSSPIKPVEEKSLFFENVDSILFKVNFNSSIDEVLLYELGKTYPNYYEALPQPDECGVKYYWRYLNESPLGRGVLNFFEEKGMKNCLSDDSFVVYSFKDRRLVKIDLRIYSSVNNFYEQYMNALGLNSEEFPSKYIAKHNNFYYIAGIKRSESSYHLVICNHEGYTLCDTDWWNI